MKKIVSAILILTLVCAVVCLTACGNNVPVGSYSVTSIEINSGIEGSWYSAGITVNENGNVVFGKNDKVDGQDVFLMNGVKFENGKLVGEGFEYPYTYEDGKLTLMVDDNKVIFERSGD